MCLLESFLTSGVPRDFVQGGSTNSVEDRGQGERGSGGGSPIVRGSGGSCNFISYSKLLLIFWYFKTICDDN